MDNECTGFLGSLLGHNFEPRYDEAKTNDNLPDVYRADLVLDGSKVDFVEAAMNTRSTYVYDICVRCGKVVHREERND